MQFHAFVELGVLRFLADGPPSGGIVQCTPQSGFAVTTAFSGTTFAWYDEDAPCPDHGLLQCNL